MPPNNVSLQQRYDAALDLYAARPKQLPPLRSAYKCLRILLLLFNMIVLIFGCVLIGLAGVASKSVANSFVGETLPLGLTAIGAFTILLSLLGAAAAWKQNRPLLWTYLVCLMLIVIVMFSVALAIYVKRSQMDEYVVEGWASTSLAFRDAVQNELQCCGLKVYGESAGAPDGHGCPQYPAWHTVNVTCFDKVQSLFLANYKQLGGAGIAFAVLMTLGMIVVGLLDRGVILHKKEIAAYEDEYKRAEEEEERLDALESDSEDESSGEEESDDEQKIDPTQHAASISPQALRPAQQPAPRVGDDSASAQRAQHLATQSDSIAVPIAASQPTSPQPLKQR